MSYDLTIRGDERYSRATAREALDASSAARALDTIEKLETVADVRPLCEILRS